MSPFYGILTLSIDNFVFPCTLYYSYQADIDKDILKELPENIFIF